MSIMELKLTQLLSQIDPDRLFLVFLDLQKAYDAVDRDLLLITLEGCGSGSRMCGLMETFWDYQQVVPRHNGFRRPSFPTTRGTFQGRLVSLTLFYVVVDSVISKMDGYDGGRPEGGSGQTGRDRWEMRVGLLCRHWHGRITRLVMATARNERTGLPVYKVWPGGQRRKVMHNDLPVQSIMGRDVGGGHGTEVHGGRRLVSTEIPKADTLTGV